MYGYFTTLLYYMYIYVRLKADNSQLNLPQPCGTKQKRIMKKKGVMKRFATDCHSQNFQTGHTLDSW